MAAKDGKTLAWIMRSAAPERGKTVLLVVVRVLLAIVLTAVSLSLRTVVDAAVRQDARAFGAGIAVFVSLVVAEIVLYAASRQLSGKLTTGIEMRLRNAAYTSLMKSAYEKIASLHSGEWAGKILTCSRLVAQGLLHLVPELAGIIVQLVCAVFALHAILPASTPVIFIAVVAMVVCAALMRGRMVELHRQIQTLDSKAAGYLQEQIASVAVVRSFSGEDQSVSFIKSAFDKVKDVRDRWTTFMTVASGGVHAAAQLGFALGVAVCCKGVYDGVMTAGALTALVSLVQQLATPLSGAFGVLPSYYSMIANAEALMGIEALPPDRSEDPVAADEIDAIYTRLSGFGLRNVSFGYEEGKPVLEGLSIDIGKGEFIALTGDSGGGKTTILKLLIGLYNPDGGERYVRFEDGSERPLDASLRRLFAYIPQENGLISGTIREGLGLGDPEAAQDDERVRWALETACAWEFVAELDGGVDAELGERGFGLSEGQMQRLAVARALLAGRPVLMLDEATSALDMQTERQLLENLRGLEDVTVIAVAHRPAIREVCTREIEL